MTYCKRAPPHGIYIPAIDNITFADGQVIIDSSEDVLSDAYIAFTAILYNRNVTCQYSKQM